MKQLLSIFGFIAIILGLVWVTSCSQNKEEEIKVITFNTTLGPIVIELFEEEAPVTAKNFLDYAENGFFNGTLFHRVIPGFVIQGGGMETGMQEKKGNPPIQNDPHSASSQFFINLENNVSLDHTEETSQGWGYAVFGEVVDGFETVEAIAAVQTGGVSFHQDVPLEEISVVDTVVTTE
jgi:peptidyl-prolyl cis-trans isomerase B (cyclophilin B)